MIARTPARSPRCAWLPLSLLLLSACGSPIVGAQCRKGFVACDGVCVDVSSDRDHCGACGRSCGADACHAGTCGPGVPADAGPDASGPDAGVDASVDASVDGGFGTVGPGKGGVGTPFLPDGGLQFPDEMVAAGCGIGLRPCDGACVDTELDRLHCGGCGLACGADQYCVEGMCTDICDEPLQLCRGQCVDYATNENNCGGCGNVCASGICNDGVCADAFPGSLVVIGHDYSAYGADGGRAISPAMKRIAGNAVFLGRGAPVRALIYRGTASGNSWNGVIDAVNYVVQQDGRDWVPVEVESDQVSEQLRSASAFVIMPQPGLSDGELEDLGRMWGMSLTQFLMRGGVVVLFDTESSTNHGTYHLLEPAGLFSAAGREALSPVRQTLSVQDPGVGVALRATSTYRSSAVTVHFLDVTSDGMVVVGDPAGKPVVVHRVITPAP